MLMLINTKFNNYVYTKYKIKIILFPPHLIWRTLHRIIHICYSLMLFKLVFRCWNENYLWLWEQIIELFLFHLIHFFLTFLKNNIYVDAASGDADIPLGRIVTGLMRLIWKLSIYFEFFTYFDQFWDLNIMFNIWGCKDSALKLYIRVTQKLRIELLKHLMEIIRRSDFFVKKWEFFVVSWNKNSTKSHLTNQEKLYAEKRKIRQNSHNRIISTL